MTQLTLFGPEAPPKRPAASDAVLHLLADVRHCTDRDYYGAIGYPEVGQKRRTVDAAIERGWLVRELVGDSDTEGGPRRLHLTDAGRAQVEAHDAWCDHYGWARITFRYAEGA